MDYKLRVIYILLMSMLSLPIFSQAVCKSDVGMDGNVITNVKSITFSSSVKIYLKHIITIGNKKYVDPRVSAGVFSAGGSGGNVNLQCTSSTGISFYLASALEAKTFGFCPSGSHFASTNNTPTVSQILSVFGWIKATGTTCATSHIYIWNDKLINNNLLTFAPSGDSSWSTIASSIYKAVPLCIVDLQ